MRKTYHLFAILLVCNFLSFAQTSDQQKAQNYISSKGELTFSFQVNDPSELKQITSEMSIVNFNPETNMVKVWANAEEFQKFQSYGINFKVDDADNSSTGVVMSNEIEMMQRSSEDTNPSLAPYTLSFPMTAYPTYANYASQMQAFEDNHPAICEMIDIGGTAEGASGGNKRLLFVKLSGNVSTSEAEPKVMYTSSMHGDEITGYVMMLNLIDYFITAYEDTGHPDHARIQNLLDNSEVWINPLANPDGAYYNSASNTSVTNARRANGNNVDINRNFPDNVSGPHPDGNSYQAETISFMTLADNNHFVLAANFHGGTEVVNYPFDNTYTNHADTDWFFLTGKEFAENCQNDAAAAPYYNNGYMDAVYANNMWPGVTEGADWYQVYGGRQDFMNYYHQCKEVTIELSNTKTPPASQLDDHWDYTREALIEYLIQGTYGFRGIVKDAISGDPLEAKITLVGHDAINSHTVSSLPFGDFYRPVYAGTYDILIEVPCYQSVTLSSETIANYQTKDLGEIFLTPATVSAPTSLNTSGTDANSTNATWSATTADSFDIRYREVGSSTWIEVTGVSNPYQITGLNSETTYEFQVRSYCGANSTSYSSSQQFTTLAFSYCDAQGNNINDEYISNVSINGFGNNTQSSTASGYSDYTSLSVFPDLDLNSAGNSISVTKHWTGSSYREAVSVWIDFNHDGTFDTSERIVYSSSTTTATVNGTFSVPNTPTAQLGSTRMRVIMKYYSGAGNYANDPCETFGYGEVEDYSVNIVDSTLGIENLDVNTVRIFPNPFKNSITIKTPTQNNYGVEVFDVSGRVILNQKYSTGNGTINLNLGTLSQGAYFIKVSDLESHSSVTKQIIKQ